jgi:hypothetical protein
MRRKRKFKMNSLDDRFSRYTKDTINLWQVFCAGQAREETFEMVSYHLNRAHMKCQFRIKILDLRQKVVVI